MTGCTQLCNQGRDCTCTPSATSRYTCDQLGVCQARGSPVPPEAGNVHLDLIDDQTDIVPFAAAELAKIAIMFSIFLACGMAVIDTFLRLDWVHILGWWK